MPSDLWIPVWVAAVVVIPLFVVSYIYHEFQRGKQRRDPNTPRDAFGKLTTLPQDRAWYGNRTIASRSLWVVFASVFPGFLVYGILWAISAGLVLDAEINSTWQAPIWWTLLWTILLLTLILGYITRPWWPDLNVDASPTDDYPENWDEVRRQVYARDQFMCVNCRQSGIELHAHHVVPLSAGGSNELTNLVTLCVDCHKRLHPHMRA